jgi:hypothetical protein
VYELELSSAAMKDWRWTAMKHPTTVMVKGQGFRTPVEIKNKLGLGSSRFEVVRDVELNARTQQLAMADYAGFDFDADDFTLPPQIETDAAAPSWPTNTTTTARPTSPIQIDEEVVVKQKRKPTVKLIDR